jgi:hypothetical protein
MHFIRGNSKTVYFIGKHTKQTIYEPQDKAKKLGGVPNLKKRPQAYLGAEL